MFPYEKARLGERALTHERDGERRARDGVGDHEEEDGEGEEHGDAERDLLAGVGRQEEADHDEHRQHQTRQHDVHQIELVASLQASNT